MLCEVWLANQSRTLAVGLRHLHEAKLCETKPDPHYRADAQEQLHGHHRPTRLDGYQQQGRVLPMTEIREITRAIVQEIGKRDARIYELEQEVEFLTKTLDIISAEAAAEEDER